ncbi:MAG: cytochrome c biogenesis protein CcsA [Planctomycetes bacterium]|nr:cytochrome c biogenesis protein CcsA [Planctomycetota bacterium]
METFSYRSLLYVTMYISACGGLLGIVTAFGWFLRPLIAAGAGRRAALAGGGDLGLDGAEGGSSPLLRTSSWLLLATCGLAFVANLAAQAARYVEVQHWPAQTMYEVIPLGTTSCFLSVLILYFVIGLQRQRGVARGFGDLFVALLMGASAFILHYVLGLDPSGKALPPALQSYWFATHISAYMFGYFTLFIATVAAWLHFCFKFWRGVLQPREFPLRRGTLLLTLSSVVVMLPFGLLAQALGPGVLLLTGVFSLASMKLPGKMAWFDTWEEGADRFTFLIFMVGFPFLTAGLIQGGLWAQEAWALYWGWDSKEVSALISWIFYIVYLHLRFVAGWRGEKGMWILLFGGISIYITFQLFGHLPASQSSLHRYTDMESVPAEGMMGGG